MNIYNHIGDYLTPKFTNISQDQWNNISTLFTEYTNIKTDSSTISGKYHVLVYIVQDRLIEIRQINLTRSPEEEYQRKKEFTILFRVTNAYLRFIK